MDRARPAASQRFRPDALDRMIARGGARQCSEPNLLRNIGTSPSFARWYHRVARAQATDGLAPPLRNSLVRYLTIYDKVVGTLRVPWLKKPKVFSSRTAHGVCLLPFNHSLRGSVLRRG
jgi:hypothetical protein